MYKAILCITENLPMISYCVGLFMVTIPKHIFINILQTEHFSAIKFGMGYEKNLSFLVIQKSPKEKSCKNQTGLL